MDRKSKGLLYLLYRALWSRIGRRPWTYIIRDSYHSKPLLWLALATGIGILLGHLFWGTPWVP
ncbi:unnamed protein product, partial [marine sediment metagenome]